MKTPLDNFKLIQEQYSYIPENSDKPVHVALISLVHNTLPILFKRKLEWTWKLGEFNPEGINQCTVNLFKNFNKHVQEGNAQTFCDENSIGLETVPNGKLGFRYTPEWDKEKESWFVLNENNEKIYE